MTDGLVRPRALLLASVLSALLGQSLLTGSPLPLLPPGAGASGSGFRAGALLLALAILLAFLSGPRSGREATAPGPRRLPAAWLAAGGVAASVAAALLYGLLGESLAVRLLWPLGVVLFVAAFWRDRGSATEEHPGPSRWWDAALLCAIAAGGFALRYVRLTDWPAELDGDFASAGLQVASLSGDARWVGVGDSNLPLVFYRLLQAGTKVFGLNLHGLMAGSVLFGTLSIGAAYLLGREVGGRLAGLLAAALLATGYTAIHFSRVILTPSAMLAVTLMLVFLLRALRSGGGRWFALAGVAGGAACLLYFGGRVAPLVAVVLLIQDMATAGAARARRLKGWATMAAAALLTLGPMLLFYARVPRALVARGADVTLFSERNRAHLMGKYGASTMGEVVLEQVRRTFLTFHLFGDSSSEFGFQGPMLDTLTAAFLLVGLGLLLRRIRSPSAAGLLAWLGGVLLVGGVLTLDPPDWVHLVVALPALVVLASLGLSRAFDLFGGTGGPTARALVTGVLLVALAGTAVDDWRRYRRAVEDNAGPQCAAARWIATLPSDTRVLLVRDPLSFEDRTLRFYDRGVNGRDVTGREIRDLTSVDRPTAVVLTPNHAEELFPLLLRRFPQAEAFSHFSHGWLHFHSVRIVPPGTAAAPPYDSLGRTSPVGWALGFLVAALAGTAAFWLPRGRAARAGTSSGEPEVLRAPPRPAGRRLESAPPPRPSSGPRRMAAPAAAPSEEVRHPVLLVLGTLLAFAAQALLDVGRPEGLSVFRRLLGGVPGPVLLGGAVALLLLGGLSWWLALSRAGPPQPRVYAPRRRPGTEVAALFLPALLPGLLAAVRFVRSGEDGWVRLGWAASLLALLAAFGVDALRHRSRPEEREISPPFRWPHLLLLALVLAVAAWLRFHDLGALPDDFHGDMASYGLTAREYLVDGETRIFGVAWAEIPRLGYQPTVLAMRVFGNDVRGLMSAAAVGGMLFLLALYALVWRLFDSHRLALLSVGVAAGNAVLIHFSRIAAYMDPWPFCLGALFFAVDGLKARRPLSFALSGVLLGFGVQMYYSGRVAVPALAALLLHAALFRRDRLRGSGLSLAAGAAGFLLTLGPNIPFFLANAQAIWARTRDVWIFTPSVLAHLTGKFGTASPLGLLFDQAGRTLLTFNSTIDTSTQFGYTHAMFVPFLAPLVVLGFVRALCRLREDGPALMVSLWALLMALGGFLTVDAPFWPRLVGVIAPASLFAALALDVLMETAASRFPLARRAAPLGVALLLAAAAAVTFRTYRSDMERNARSQALIGRYLATLPSNVTACSVVDPFWLEVRETAFLAWPRRLVDLRPEEAASPPPPCTTPPVVWILSENHIAALHDLSARWPDGVAEEHRAKGGDPVFVSFRVLSGRAP